MSLLRPFIIVVVGMATCAMADDATNTHTDADADKHFSVSAGTPWVRNAAAEKKTDSA
jgi:heme O synthase-like polyprenyltransferase